MTDHRASRLLAKLETPLLLAVPVVMTAVLLVGIEQAALAMLVVVALVLALFFAGYEASRPGLRQIMPTLVLAALAAAGRILFGPIPDFKPVSAIAIIAGATLGRRNGFMVGALAALTSNFFFGQGMWTPWQMYAWGLVGYVGGVLAHVGAFDRADGTVRMPALLAYGFASGLLYGVVNPAATVYGVRVIGHARRRPAGRLPPRRPRMRMSLCGRRTCSPTWATARSISTWVVPRERLLPRARARVSCVISTSSRCSWAMCASARRYRYR